MWYLQFFHCGNTSNDEIKQTIIHFTNQLKQSETELNFKVEQMDDIKLELKRLEKKEFLQNS